MPVTYRILTCTALFAATAIGCDNKSGTRTTTTTTQTPSSTTTTVRETPAVDPAPAGNVEVKRDPNGGLNVDVEPRRPGDAKVDVDVGGPNGVRVDIDGKPLGERIQERREERRLNDPVAP